MMYTERTVDTTIINNVVRKIYSKLHLGMRSCGEYAGDVDETSCVVFSYKKHYIVLTQKIDDRIVLYKYGSDKETLCTFTIKDYIDDDSLSLVIKDNRLGSDTKFHVKHDIMARAMIDYLNSRSFIESMLYKNKPKMQSSQYGVQLHDISIACTDE